MGVQQHTPMHPGAFIKRVYMDEFSIGSNKLARKLQVSTGAVSRLLNEKMDVSPAMAIKLSLVIGRSPESWLAMQDNFNLWLARKEIDQESYERLLFAV